MINLAGLRYRRIFASEGGPIDRVETADILLEGRRLFQANAFLRSEFLPAQKRKRSVYSEASGSGTHLSPLVARFMAISEALERWAYTAKVLSPERAAYAFDVDPMSNGMAAFPGMFARQARKNAYFEAVERFNIIAWWEGLLPAREAATEWPGVNALILGDDSDSVTVIVHKDSGNGVFSYGHAAAADFNMACRKAMIELSRHEYVVRSYRFAQTLGGVVAAPPVDLLERRSLFFASEEGRETFIRRVQSGPTGPRPVRRVAFDGAIPGPWTRYADVWRVVYHPVSARYLSNEERYFLW